MNTIKKILAAIILVAWAAMLGIASILCYPNEGLFALVFGSLFLTSFLPIARLVANLVGMPPDGEPTPPRRQRVRIFMP